MDITTLLEESDWIGGLAARLVRDGHQAEDLAQDTRLAALESGPVAPGKGGSLRPWLATVARNQDRMRGRTAGAREAREFDRARHARDDTAASPEELLERAETQELLLRLVRKLPSELSDVVLASFFEGQGSAEIARHRNLSQATVRARKREALKRLREQLDARFEGDRAAWFAALMPLVPPHLVATATGAKAAAAGPTLAGISAAWIAMTLTWKIILITSVAGLAALGTQVFRSSIEPGSPVQLVVRSVDGPANAAIEAPGLPIESAAQASDSRAAERLAAAGPSTEKPAPSADAALPPTVTRVSLRVVDQNGQPVAGARVTPRPSREIERANEAAFKDLSPAAIAVLAAGMTRTSDASGMVDWETDLLRFGGLVRFTAVGPRLGTGELAHELEIGDNLRVGDLVLQAAGAVVGNLKMDDGSPAPTQMVFLVKADSSLLEGEPSAFGLLGHDDVVVSVSIDAAGAFRMTGIPAGQYVLTTSRLSGFQPVRSAPFEVVVGDEGQPIDLTIATPELGRPQVLVLDSSGEPLAGAKVVLRSLSVTFTGTTRANGTYSLSTTYGTFAGGRIEVSDNSLRHRAQVVDPVPELPQTITVRLEKAPIREVALDLVSQSGTVPKNHEVTVTSERGTLNVSGEGNSASFVLPAGQGETFDISIRANGFQPADLSGLQAVNLADPWILPLVERPGVEGRVLVDGKPVARAKVSLYRLVSDGDVVVQGSAVSLLEDKLDSTTTDSDGRYGVDPPTSGDYVIRASSRRRADSIIELRAFDPDRGRRDLNFELEARGTVEGTVHNGSGAAMAGVTVVLAHPHYDFISKRTKADGTFRAMRVPAGDWHVRVVQDFNVETMKRHLRAVDGWRFPSNCTVLAGQTTTVDPAPIAERTSLVGGAWAAEGADVGDWSVELGAGGIAFDVVDPFLEPWSETSSLDADGRYEILASADTEHYLTVTAPRLYARFRRPVLSDELPLVLDTRIELARLVPEYKGAADFLFISWTNGEWSFSRALRRDTEGAFPEAIVPAGAVSVSWDRAGSDEQGSVTLELTKGEQRSVELED